MHIHAGLGALFGPNTGLAWGLSIAVLVMIIRLLLVPLFVKQVHAQRKMAQHAPHLAELRKKYKNDKQRLNEETMKFYKENGVNPLAGCLPMIPQMIVFFSLFYVLRAIADWTPKVTHPSYELTTAVMHSAQQAKIFGVHLGDKLLFSHQAGPLHVAVVIVLTVSGSAAAGATDAARGGASRATTQSTARPASGSAKPAAGSGSGAAKTAASSAKSATGSARTAASSAKTGTNSARSSGAAKPAAAGASAGANGRASTPRPPSATAGARAAPPPHRSAPG